MKLMNKRISYLLTALIAVSILFTANSFLSGSMTRFEDDTDMPIEKATVESIVDKTTDSYDYDGDSMDVIEITFEARFASGDKKDEIVTASQTIESTPPYNSTNEVKPGDSILIIDAGIDASEW